MTFTADPPPAHPGRIVLPAEASAPASTEAAHPAITGAPPAADPSTRTLSAPANRRTRLWAARAIWLGLLAFLVGGLGELVLLLQVAPALGGAILVLAMLLGVLAWRARAEGLLPSASAAGQATHIAWRPVLLLRLAGLGWALALDLLALRAYLDSPSEIFGLQGWLWIASMALFLGACARWYPRASREEDLGPPWTRREAAVFAGLLSLALFTHLARLNDIPWRFHFDEGFAYTETMRYYRGPMIPLFTTTWHATSLPSFWFAFAAGLMRLGATGLGGVRLGVALIGALLIVPVYGIARLCWGRLAAALAGFAVAVSAAAVHYSRVSILNITTAFWWAVCFYFLLRGLRSRRPGDFAWAGLAAGTSMYTYYGTRLLPYLLLAFCAYLLVFHFRAMRERLGHFALLGLGFVIGFGPLLGYFQQNPAMWAGRGLSVLNVPAGIPVTWAGWGADWNVLAPLAWRNYLGLSVVSGRDTVYYAPLLLAPEAVLLTLGVALLIRQWRQPGAFLLLLAGLGVVLTGGTLLDADTIPNFAHWTPAFSVIYLALALPLARWAGALRQAPRRLRRLGYSLVALLLVADAGANAYAYLVVYPLRVPPDYSLEALQGRYIESLPPATRMRVVGPSWQPYYGEVAQMIRPQLDGGYLANGARELPLVGDPTSPLAFLFYKDRQDAIPTIQSLYPGGVLAPVQTPDGNEVADSYEVPAAVAWQAYGAHFTVIGGQQGNTRQDGQVALVGQLPAGMTIQYPAKVEWSGTIYLTSTTPVRLTVQGDPGAQVLLAGARIPAGAPIVVQPGWVRYRVESVWPGPRVLHLMVQQNNGPSREADRAHLWPAITD